MNEQRFVLGVDLGTGSARAFLFDMEARRQGGVRLRYSWRLTVEGAVEVDADDVVELTRDAIDGALLHLPAGGRVVGVGISGLWHTLLGVDASGVPVTPVIGWNDTRATDATRALRAQLDGRAVHERTGATLHPGYPPARLAWLRDARPERFRRAARWLSLPEYLWWCLTGRYDADVSVAAGSGLLDRRTLQWDEELCDAVGITPGQLSDVACGREAAVGGNAVHCTGERQGSRFWPQLRDAVWRMPIGDGACANVGSGCIDASTIGLSIGTSAAMRVVVSGDVAQVPEGLWCYRLDAASALLGGAISNGGLVRSWLLSLLRLPHDDVELDTLLTARPAAGHGLDMLPFLAGERSPEWPLDATAVIGGLRAATSPLDVLQAGMEAVAYRLVLVRRLIAGAVPSADTVVASGGAVRQSPFWAQLLADAFGQTVSIAADAEASSRGAAMFALLAAGEVDDLHQIPQPPTSPLEPDPERHAAHAAALERHLQFAARNAGDGDHLLQNC